MKSLPEARKIATSLLTYALVYAGLILALGYEYGTGDLIEITPYWDAFFHPEKWTNDFFVSAQLERIPNERFFFVWLLSVFGPPSPWISLTGHFLTTLGLLLGLDRLASLWIKPATARLGIIWMICLALYGINTGGNEIYYPFLTNSYLAQSIGIWAIYTFLKDRPWATSILLTITALTHILIGLQLTCLIGGSVMILALLKKLKPQNRKKWLGGAMIWIGIAGTYLVFLLTTVTGGHLDSTLQMDIMEFRLPHHFFPAYFPMRSWLVYGLLSLAGLWYFRKREPRVLLFLMLSIEGALIYTAGIYLLHSHAILSSQWFESTIWLEALGVMAVAAVILDLKPEIVPTRLDKPIVWSLAITAMIAGLVSSPAPVFNSRTIGQPLGMGPQEEISISEWAHEHIPDNAVFALPPQVTAFKWYGQRASYVDYKAMLHHKEMLGQWHDRVNWLYGIDINDRRTGDDLYEKAALHMAEMLDRRPGELRAKGITHMILPAQIPVDHTALFSNSKYSIYQLD